MNAIIFFALMTVINVTLSTIRSLCTIKGGKWLSAITNAVCYGFYPLIVMLTAKDTVTIWVNMIITAVANFVCVWLIKLVEEKARKDKLWKVEIAVAKCYQKDVERNLLNVPHNCIDTGSWVMFNCYCNCQSETAYVVDIAKRYKGKISAYESKSLIQTSLGGGLRLIAFLFSAARSLASRAEFSVLKHYSIFSFARAPGKLHKKILKSFYSLCILPIVIQVVVQYNR